MRLDVYLVQNHNLKTRNIAKQYIENGYVLVNDVVCYKPSLEIEGQIVKIINNLKYVSRAGYKLEAALKKWNINIENKIVLDIGASTGGFSDCCIQNGAKLVFALDVGTNQLDAKLLESKKIVNLSNTNIKDINKNLISDTIEFIVSDLSFISSKFMFESLKNINIKNGSYLISLIKPQFELNKEILNKNKGKVIDQKYHDLAIKKVVEYAKNNCCKVIDIMESPLLGAKKQNKEFLIWCKYEKK